jgi:hypothetical protein
MTEIDCKQWIWMMDYCRKKNIPSGINKNWKKAELEYWKSKGENMHEELKKQFQPEYFSGLNWQDAKKLVGRPIEFSNDPGYEGWETGILESLDYNQGHRFKILHRWFYEYTRTCPDTFQDSHPTIRITVNGKDYDLPKPETEAPDDGALYWAIDPLTENGIEKDTWRGHMDDKYRLSNMAVHFTEDRAQAWADFWKEIYK